MSVQVRLLVKSFVALGIGTPERFFSGVDAQVRLQIEVETKLLIADLTLVWLFASMYQHVSFEFRIVKESFVAKFKRALELNVSNSGILTSLSPWTVMCFLREALSLKIFAQDSR